jgi:integrase
VIRRALKDAVRWGYITRNVADAANRPRNTRTPEMKTWTAEQLAQFLDYVREHDSTLYPLWRLFATSGLRRGEALGARWQDLDLDAGRLAIRQTLLARGKRLTYGEPKTKKSRRSVALDASTVKSLRHHRTSQASEKLAAGQAYSNADLVFADALGGPLHPDVVSKSFKAHLRATGLPDLNLHGLRHSHATLALQAGLHPKVVSERLGHSSVALTLDVYSHLIPAMQQDAADVVSALIDEIATA